MKLTIIGILGLLSFLGFQCTEDPRSPEQLYEAAQVSYEAADYRKALGLFRMAAERDHPWAQLALGEYYERGSLSKDATPSLLKGMLRYVRRDTVVAARWNRRAENNLYREASQGEVKALAWLALLYSKGWHRRPGFVTDESKARFFLWQAIDWGDPRAMTLLAGRYRKEQRYRAAMGLLAQAVRLGNHWAYLQLAEMYLAGEGVPRSAERYYEIRWEAVERQVPGAWETFEEDLALLLAEARRGNRAAQEHLIILKRMGVFSRPLVPLRKA